MSIEMKTTIVIAAILLASLVTATGITFAQQDPVRIGIAIRDNGTGADTLIFGLACTATRCLDVNWGEYELPPRPPTGLFEARFVDPTGSTGDCMGLGTLTDIRELCGSSVDTFRLRFQPGEGGYPVHFSWPRNPGAYWGSLRLKDPFGLGIVNVDMRRDTSFDLKSSVVTELMILAERSVDPCRGSPCLIGIKAFRNAVPDSFSLRQDSSPSTALMVDVRDSSFVEIVVCNTRGAKVKHLVRSGLHPATYSVTWDGTDDSGGKVGSGPYLVKMSAIPAASKKKVGPYHSTLKVMLAR
jgi:hypothetical protein